MTYTYRRLRQEDSSQLEVYLGYSSSRQTNAMC